MKHLEDEIMRVCEGSTYAEKMSALTESICRTQYIEMTMGEVGKICDGFYDIECRNNILLKSKVDLHHDTLIDNLDSLLDILKAQIKNRFENHINELRDECLKKIH